MVKSNTWFVVDKTGLSQILERRGGKVFLLYELYQNGMDEPITEMNIELIKNEDHRGCYRLIATDDAPSGFDDLDDTFTLFKSSKKKGDAEKRGRFNLGEKLFLACCRSAEIVSTTGGVLFDSDGSRRKTSKKVKKGSVITADIRMTNEEFHQCSKDVFKLIPPKGMKVKFQGEVILPRKPVAVFEATLKTEIADEEGRLKPTARKTFVEVHEVKGNEIGYIYEMGIPVVETGDRYHVNVMQKVPVNLDRDNVPPSYLRKLRTLTLNATHDLIEGEEEATQGWIRDALEDKDCLPEAAASVMKERFGDKVVSYDPSDREANSRAASNGYAVIPGGAFSKSAWEKIRSSDAVKPAGQSFPTPKPFSPDGTPLKTISQEDLTDDQKKFVEYAKTVAKDILGFDIVVTLTDDEKWGFMGCFSTNEERFNPIPQLHANVSPDHMGSWISNFPDAIEHIDNFLLHEFAHSFESNHLSGKYHEACTTLGARLKKRVLENTDRYRKYLVRSRTKV